MDRKIEIKEALWVVSVSCIGLIFLILLHQSGGVMAECSETGTAKIPLSFWVWVTVYVSFCSSVFILLKESESIEFKIHAFILTGIVPIVAILLIILNLLNVECQ